MTSKDKVLNAIAGKPCTEVPLWRTWYFDGFRDNWRQRYPERGEIEHYLGYDTAIWMGNEGFFPSKEQVLKDDGQYATVSDSWGRIEKISHDGYFSQTLKYPIEDYDDLDKLTFEPAADDSRFSDYYEVLQAEKDKGKCVFAKIGGIYVRSHFLRAEEELLADMLAEEQWCNELFDKVTEHFLQMALETLKRSDLWDTGLFVYDDMASTYNTMFSPKVFEKYFLPRYKRLIGECKAKGCKHVFFHSDGNILPVMDMLIEAGFEGFNPLERRSGLDVVALKQKYGSKVVLFGGVCNTEILPRGDKEEIRRHVLPIVEAAKNGGIIVGTHTVAEDISPEIYDYYIELVRGNL